MGSVVGEALRGILGDSVRPNPRSGSSSRKRVRPRLPHPSEPPLPRINPEARYLTTKQAAEYLSVHLATLYRLMDKGLLGYVKFGRARRIPRHALAEFERRHYKEAWNDA